MLSTECWLLERLLVLELEGRDLALTTDFRAVFADVLTHHLGATTVALKFPGYDGPSFSVFPAR